MSYGSRRELSRKLTVGSQFPDFPFREIAFKVVTHGAFTFQTQKDRLLRMIATIAMGFKPIAMKKPTERFKSVPVFPSR